MRMLDMDAEAPPAAQPADGEGRTDGMTAAGDEQVGPGRLQRVAARSDAHHGLAGQSDRPSQRRQPSPGRRGTERRSEEHTSELQSLMRISYAVFCLKKKI